MLILTTPRLATGAERLDAWWTVTQQLRPDVAVRSQIAGLALALSTGDARYPWLDRIRTEAADLGELEYAEELLVGVTAG